jgi:hypothetical protein
MEENIQDSENLIESDIVNEDTKPVETVKSDTVNMDEVKEAKETSVEVEFNEGNLLDDFDDFVEVKGSENEEVEGVEDATILENDSKKDLATVREEISVEESKNDFELEDYQFASEIIIEGLAWGLGWVLCFVAMEKDEEKYTPSKKRNEKLAEILTKVLIRTNVKFSFMTSFIVMMLITYGTLTATAMKNRKEVKKKKEEEEHKKYIEAVKVEQANIIDEEVKEVQEILVETGSIEKEVKEEVVKKPKQNKEVIKKEVKVIDKPKRRTRRK